MMPPTDGSQDLQKHIGCLNGIFQLFDHRHVVMAQRQISNQNYKGGQMLGCRHRLDSNQAKRVPTQKDQEKQEKPRASAASLSGSSAFSSLAYYRTAHIYMSENMSHVQDVVKSSMNREARGTSVECNVHGERKISGFRHIDSPRPLQQSKNGTSKATSYEGFTPVLSQVWKGQENSKEERIPLPRFSFDGRESRQTFNKTIKIKEFPRLSLDSRSCKTKCSPGQNFQGQGLMTKIKKSNAAVPSASPTTPSSSIVTKLMGLDSFPDNVSTYEQTGRKAESSPCRAVAFPSTAVKTTAESKEARVNCSAHVSRRNPTSLSSVRYNSNTPRTQTRRSRIPLEPAPWRQRDPTEGSMKKTAQSRKGSTDAPQLSASVYGEIEKRINILEFKRTGNDLRALKQILEVIHNAGERQENWAELTTQNNRILESRQPNQNFKVLMYQNRKSYQDIPTIKGTCCLEQLGSSNVKIKSTEVMENAKSSSSSADLQKVRPNSPKTQKENPGYRRNANLTPRRDSTTASPPEQTLKVTQSRRATKFPISRRDSTTASPKLLRSVSTFEELPSSPHSARDQKPYNKKGKGKCSQNRKHETKAMCVHLNNDMQVSMNSSDASCSNCQGDATSIKSESNITLGLQTEIDGINSIKSMKSSYREQQATMSTSKDYMPVAEFTIKTMDQPSPVSVLDSMFYNEDTPSPVEKMSTAFRDGSPCTTDEAEMYAENPNKPTDYCTRTHTSLSNNNEETRVYVEEVNDETVEWNGWMTINQKFKRRIVSDMLNETIAHGISLDRPLTDGERRISPYELIKEVYQETDHQCRIPSCNRSDLDDRLHRLLISDSNYSSDDLVTYKGQVPSLVLAIERLVFKDLINEVVKVEIMSHYNWLKRRHQRLCIK